MGNKEKQCGFCRYEEHLKLKSLKEFLSAQIDQLQKEDKRISGVKYQLEVYQLIYLKTFGEYKGQGKIYP